MNIGLIINVISLSLTILIAGVYFSKKRISLSENMIYGNLLIVTIIGLSINTLSFLCDIYFPEFLNIRLFLIKLYYAYILSFAGLMTTYLICLGNKNGKNISKYVMFGDIALMIINFMLPLEFDYTDNQVYLTGVDTIYVYVIVFISTIFWLLYTIMHITKDNKRKYLPVILYSIFVFPIMGIQAFYPTLLLEPFLIAYVLTFMYHAIENPDMKLLEEMHKSKEISDNVNEEKTLFLYNMTQEIRSITNKIDDNADTILDSKDIETIYDAARDIKANASNFTSMMNEILDIGTIDSTTIKIYNSKYNIKLILKQLINIYSNTCKNKELKFITNIDHDIPDSLYGDAINLKEVLTIILNNSTKYTQKGYVELNVNTIIKNDICRLIITVEDSGIGIKSEDIDKLKLEDNSLSKANKLLTVMNGTMLISSEYGIGTKVKVILDQKIELNDNQEILKYESTFDNISILTVDDSESGLKIIEKLLKGTDIKIDKAYTGKECLDMIRLNKYDLILLDEELDQISGIELMKKITAIRNFDIPVILLTKDNNYEYKEDHLKEGFCDYLLKPLKKETLLEKIDKYTKNEK